MVPRHEMDLGNPHNTKYITGLIPTLPQCIKPKFTQQPYQVSLRGFWCLTSKSPKKTLKKGFQIPFTNLYPIPKYQDSIPLQNSLSFTKQCSPNWLNQDWFTKKLWESGVMETHPTLRNVYSNSSNLFPNTQPSNRSPSSIMLQTTHSKGEILIGT